MANALEEFLWQCFLSVAILFGISIVLFIPYGLYQLATTETFSLVKADWMCSRKELRNTFESTVASNGSVVVVPSTTAICVQYTLKSTE